MLGVDYKKHVPRVFKALGIAGLLTGESSGRHHRHDRKIALVPVVFGKVTECIREAIAAKTWAELEPVFKEHDIWHTSVATAAEAACNEQARVTRTFRYASEEEVDVPRHVRVNAPLQITRWRTGDVSKAYGEPDDSPSIGQTKSARSIKFDAFATEMC